VSLAARLFLFSKDNQGVGFRSFVIAGIKKVLHPGIFFRAHPPAGPDCGYPWVT
jgi:hypothetical protein